jgi:hypothetical protein
MQKRLRQFLKTYHGSSFPTRSETTDGAIHVVKMRGAGNGGEALLSEFVVNRLAARAGLPVPDVCVIDIAEGHPWDFGTDEFDDLLQKSPGPNLALAWLGEVRTLTADEARALPEDIISQVVTIDLMFSNFDRSADCPNLVEDSQAKVWIMDHGSCRFLFQPTSAAPNALPRNHLFAGREDAFDPRWMDPISTSLITETDQEIPELWLIEAGVSREDVREKIVARLGNSR